MIPRDTIDKIFDAVRIEEVIGEFVNLKKAGVNYKGLSPFVDEKTPSFVVSPTKGIFKDFSSGKGGNAIKFLMELEQYSYPEALRWVANKYNIEVEEQEQSPEEKERYNERESLYLVQDFAQKSFSYNLHSTEEGKAIAKSYFIERGFTEETIEKFQLGYCFDKYDAFAKKALDAGYKQDFLVKAGLIKVKEDKKYDFFRGRVTFPIHNITGKVIAFGARTLKSDKNTPKYLNSPENDIYYKSKVLYGIYHAKKDIVRHDRCFLVEGYTDVISLHQAGVENVVASSGTALTPDQIRLIKRYTNNITILYDGDPAGIKASIRGIDLVLEQGLSVKVLLFPEGDDPDSFAKKVSKEELITYIDKNSKDFIAFKSDLLLEEIQGDPIKKSALIHEVINSIALIPDAITRSVYVKECSSRFELTEQALINELNKARRALTKKKGGRDTSPMPEEMPLELLEQQQREHQKEEKAVDVIEYQEENIIRILMNFGNEPLTLAPENDDEEEEVEVPVAKFVVQELVADGVQFNNVLYQLVLNEYVTKLEKNEIPELSYFINNEDEYLSTLAVNIVASPYHLSDNWFKLHKIDTKEEKDVLDKAIINTVYSYKLAKVVMMIEENQNHIKEMQNHEGDDEAFKSIIKLLEAQKELLEVKKLLSAQLGRVVLK